MKYRLVAFDFDGTLADSFTCFSRVLNEAAKTHGFRAVTPEMVEELRGMNSGQIRRYLQIPLWKTPRVATAMRQRMFECIDEVQLFPGVGALLRELSQAGVVVGIVTSNSFANVSRVLGREHQALIHHFECDIGLFGKRRPLRRVLKQSDVPSHAALYVGDEIRDAEAARAAGWDFNGVAWGYATSAALQPHSAAPLFQRVEDILAAVIGS